MGDMTLIDRGGKRRRPICRECRRLHAARDCPVLNPEKFSRLARAAESRRVVAFWNRVSSYQAEMLRQREAERAS